MATCKKAKGCQNEVCFGKMPNCFVPESSISSADLLAVYERFKHLDVCLKAMADAEDPIYKTASVLWVAVCNANARPHAEARSADSVQADVGSRKERK